MNKPASMLVPRIETERGWVPKTAMVLAAGRGTRLAPLTDTTPKPLIPVGGLATLDRILDKLRAAGVERVVVNAHYLADQISAHVEARSDETVSVIVEEGAALETGGGVAHALDQLGDEPFFVINGDSVWLDGMSDTLRRFSASWNADAMDIQLLLYRFSQVQGYHGLGDYTMTPDGLLRRREERRVAPYAYMGVSILHPRIFKDAPDGPFSLNILYDKAENQSRLYGILHDGLWYHVSTPADLELANHRFATGHLPDVPYF